MAKRSLGEQELALLRYVAEHGPLSVGETADRFGAPLGLARSTVLTVMERLRKKGFLNRRKAGGIFQYASPVPREQLLREVVADFVHTALEGSLSPFVAWLAESKELSPDELTQLEQLVARLETKRRA